MQLWLLDLPEPTGPLDSHANVEAIRSGGHGARGPRDLVRDGARTMIGGSRVYFRAVARELILVANEVEDVVHGGL